MVPSRLNMRMERFGREFTKRAFPMGRHGICRNVGAFILLLITTMERPPKRRQFNLLFLKMGNLKSFN